MSGWCARKTCWARADASSARRHRAALPGPNTPRRQTPQLVRNGTDYTPLRTDHMAQRRRDEGMFMSVEAQVNGKPVTLHADNDTPLLWVLREELGLTGTKFGCGIGACGACSVHIDGAVARSCSVAVGTVAGKSITTIEALASSETPHRLQLAWIAHQVPQCGYCQSGQLMAAAALLATSPHPSDAEIDAALTNICRCATYVRIREAIHTAAGQPGNSAGASA